MKLTNKIKNFKMKVLSIVALTSMMAVQLEPLTGLFAAAGSLNFNPGGKINPVYDSNYDYSTGIYDATLGGANAYCMDYGRLSPSGVLSFKNKLSPQATAVLVYGYPNSSPASMGLSSNSEAHTATQLALWQISQETGENTKSTAVFDFSALSGNAGYETHAANAIAAAKRLVAKARGGYIANPTINITGNGAKLSHTGNQIVAGPYQVNVSQANVSSINTSLSGAPASAMTTDASGNPKSTFAVNENIFVRLSDAEHSGSLTLNATADGDKLLGCKYGDTNPANQDYSILSREPITLKTNVGVNWNGLNGNVQLLKVDQSNNKIPGVVFELKDSKGSVVAKETSGADGMVKFSNIAVGTYTLTEISAPDEYIMSKDPINVVVEAGKTTTVNCVNQKINGGLKIIKTADSGEALPGVTFQIYNEDKRPLTKITTGSDGIATLNNLPSGTYYYSEISAPDYVVIDTNKYEFKSTSKDVVVKHITNKTIKGNLKIVKTDSDKTPLANVKFQILDSSKKVIETITTGADGIATSKALVKGTYYYKEIEAPENVVMDTNTYEFKISSQNEVITKNIENILIKGSLKIVKTNSDKAPLANVKFQILDSSKNVVDTITTGTNGIATSKALVKGTYYYKEIEAPENVVMDTNTYEFKISSQNEVVTKNIVNKLVKGTLKIIKVDENKVPLEGVKFNIYDKNGNTIDTITTNKDGIAVSKEIQKGKYFYQEISAPEGIVIDTTKHEFIVEKDNDVIIKNIINNYKKGQLEILKLDENKKPIKNVKFEILNENNSVIATIITNDKGIATTDKLAYGNYFYKEIEAPENFVIDSNKYPFSITQNNQIIKKTITNKFVKGALRIIKVDENKVPLENVSFNIYNADGKKIETITTNNQGVAQSDKMQKGKYFYQEISAPEGIIIDTTRHEFIVETDSQVVIKNMVNNYKKGSLEILKLDENKNPIKDVKFNILNENKEIIATIVTNDKGIATTGKLVYGKYYYKEVEAPANIVMDTSEYEFSITKDNQIIKKTITNKFVKGSLKIIKVDENKTPLMGVKFQILDANDKLIDTITTNKDGIAISKELQKGKYFYKEISAPEGIVIDTTKHEFIVEKDNDLVIKNIENKLVKGKLEILKVDENKVPLMDVKFNILDKDKKVIATIVTNKDGIATSDNLSYGKYYYKEIEAPANVVIDASEYAFNITKDNQIIKKTITNKFVKGSLKIIKVDENKTPLMGVKFQILDANDKLIDTITTNKDGIAISKELQKGKYFYKEISAPEGIVIDTTKHEFVVEKDNDVVIKDIVNNFLRGKLEILKLDNYDNPIEGVKFNILNDKKQVIDTIITNKDGIATTKDLVYGKYYYKEIEAPANLVMDTHEYSFNIQENNQLIKKTVINKKLVGGIKILKLDKGTKTPIAGVTFDILNEQKQVIGTIITNDNGVAKIENLTKGKYFYKETKAPDKYIIDNKEYSFEIQNDNQLVEKTVYNESKKLPVTGGFFGSNAIIVTMVTVISILGYFVLNIITTKKELELKKDDKKE
ncbi:MAG: SpaA isopeptide-forming pilin-related protein [Clostridia bacterium]